MDKIFTALLVLGVGIGILFFPRIGRASVVENKESVPVSSSPPGIENNNPFNLEFRPAIQWRGQLGTDGRFAVFDTPINGLRAGMINIHTKFTRDGLNTVRKLLSRLSPSFENPTESFINFVSGRLNVASNQPLVFTQVILPLSHAIVKFENGEDPYTDEQYAEALRESGK